MAEVSVTVTAYCKLLLHLVKYPHCAVNGVFLAEKQKGKDQRTLKCVDVVPLFHLSIGLAPMLEIALTQIDAYCKERGLVIGGYYQANVHTEDNNPNAIAYRIADRVCDQCNDGCMFMVNNLKLADPGEKEVYRVFQRMDGKWKVKEQKHTVEEGTCGIAANLVLSGAQEDLVDFDNHLDSIEKDWRNLQVEDQIKSVL